MRNKNREQEERMRRNMRQKNTTVLKIAQTALLAALCYVSFTFLQIKIPMPGGDATSLHIGNAQKTHKRSGYHGQLEHIGSLFRCNIYDSHLRDSLLLPDHLGD